ncbi:sigma-54-dependent Fis family transcriptional regulator [Thermaurantimonas aggregans]|uniref:Sigma-54-dependent Fis family transcriptional regulator n=1 Tax=Thermaurantimonas aggregans TaxID=2173829 RepID=A0A401XLB8_9FLAO|nr:sigma-54 dependent transcriptional regulator [Thermaurantimonas aggregans]MCX8148151.1 sigma-54 dependent transcriptional regulator [Thermaurantimonas aggregans]GCD77781.1 sigma-54-dependent Fis family transcriptional regulator [Thermaurantimonas aggregans]
MSQLQEIKMRFGIIGNSPLLDRAIEKAIQVANTDISVLVTGESGVGKENIPKIIHALSHRKHKPYIAVNCGAIPEGTIDSELFGHEKGAFTGALSTRKGYFEEADGGTIFLDEVAELPLQTQVRLLRVLETGEFIKVGSSKIQKTDVRIVAATNVNMLEAVSKHKFREDLYYRLNTVEIHLPPLRERKEDIPLIFKKFCLDFAEKYRQPPLKLSKEAEELLKNYRWPGNIRQLRNLAEQISVVETNREITAEVLKNYLPDIDKSTLPALHTSSNSSNADFASEREILYKILFDMRNDLNDLKAITLELIKSGGTNTGRFAEENSTLLQKVFRTSEPFTSTPIVNNPGIIVNEGINTPHVNAININGASQEEFEEAEVEPMTEEVLSLEKREIELIKKALEKHNGKRKLAAEELGISERTLYRKIKQYNLQ